MFRDLSIKANRHLSPIVDLDPSLVKLTARRRPEYLKWLTPIEHWRMPWPVKRGIWDHLVMRFEDHPTYREIEALIAANLDYERLPAFRRALKQLQTSGKARSKSLRRNRVFSSETALRQHYEDVVTLVRDVRDHGYDHEKGSEIGLGIGRDGRLIKLKHGHHRLAVAQQLGVRRVRFQITAVHPRWVRRHVPADAGRLATHLPAIVEGSKDNIE